MVSSYEENRAVLMYVTKDKNRAVLFDYNLHSRYLEVFNRVRMQGLDPNKRYKAEEINLYPGTKLNFSGNGGIFSVDYLMKVGFQLSLLGKDQPLTSKMIEVSVQ